MKPIQILKLIWRKALSAQEAKESFFHGTERLINAKQYDRLYRRGLKQGVEMIFYNSEKDLLALKTKEGIIVETNRICNIFIEVFLNKEYSLPPQIKDEFCVFDVGMNRGYTSLFFANYSNCREVFGFELDQQTYDWSLRNFALNPSLSPKITPYNFGLWNEDEEIEYRISDSDYCTSVNSLSTEYPKMKNLFENKIFQVRKAKVKKASSQISSILKDLSEERMKILKIDIEGAEYAVFEDLYNHDVLNTFDLIMGECHNGMAELEKYLGEFTCIYKSKNKGLLLDFVYVNKRIRLY